MMMSEASSSERPARHERLQLLRVHTADGGLVRDVRLRVTHLHDRHRPAHRLPLDDLLAVHVAARVRGGPGHLAEDVRTGTVAQRDLGGEHAPGVGAREAGGFADLDDIVALAADTRQHVHDTACQRFDLVIYVYGAHRAPDEFELGGEAGVLTHEDAGLRHHPDPPGAVHVALEVPVVATGLDVDDRIHGVHHVHRLGKHAVRLHRHSGPTPYVHRHHDLL